MTTLPPTHPLLTGFPIIVALPVQWGEMDAYGHVNNTVVFRYFESARVEFLSRCGFLEAYDHEGVGAIVHSTSCRFRRPLRWPDTVLVGARALDVGQDRFRMEYRIVALPAGAIAADGSALVVSFDYRVRRKAPLPAIVRARLAEIGES